MTVKAKIGTKLVHEQSGISGPVDAVANDPAGVVLVRLDDHWFDVRGCVIRHG